MNASKLIVLASVMFLNCLSANVQAQAFKQGDDVLSVGYGFGVIDVVYTDDLQSTVMGPIYFKYEHAITDKITLGINVAFGQYTAEEQVNTFPGIWSEEPYTYTTYSILARLNWHFGNLAKFDPYWGFGFGLREESEDEDSSTPFPLGLEITIGARYYFTDKVAAYMETGIAKSVVQAGLSFKLR